MIFPTFTEEELLWKSGYSLVAGIDEVGRGAFAGPVVTAAVILPQNFPHRDEITDSKLLTPAKRTFLAAVISEHALFSTISEVCVPCINEMGIGKATQKAFLKSAKEIEEQIRSQSAASHSEIFYLIDAFLIEGISPKRQKAIIKGDQKSISIAAASIIAKVYRDTLMETLPGIYEVYDFKTNKGYGTKKHCDILGIHGLSDIHRTSFNLSKFV